MDSSTITTALQLIVTIIVVISFVYTATRNGKRLTEEDATLKTTLSIGLLTLNNKLDDPRNGLTAIKQEVGEMKERCARCQEKIERAEKDINGLRERV